MAARTIRKHDVPTQVRETLQALVVSELIQHSDVIWLVSAWISDIPVLDNSSGAFAALEPSWPWADVYLLRILRALAEQGTTIHVATNQNKHNDAVHRRLVDFERDGLPVRAHRGELHEKGFLCDRFFLFGSMNFTFSGIHSDAQSEHVELITDAARIAEARLDFRGRWGGAVA